MSAQGPESSERRSFLGVLMGIGTAAIGTLLSVPLFRFAMYPVFTRTTQTDWAELGAIDEFSSITSPVKRSISVDHRDGWRRVISEKAVYIIKSADGKLRVLSPVCPHLGCLIGWHEDKRRFISPCHGGIFSSDGALLAGPPRRAMDELESKFENGKLYVRYQYFRPLVSTKEVIG